MNDKPAFQLGDRVRKTKGSQWKGRVVGTYSTSLTPEGYAVESDTEKGSVQIYPVGALELVEPLRHPATPSFLEYPTFDESKDFDPVPRRRDLPAPDVGVLIAALTPDLSARFNRVSRRSLDGSVVMSSEEWNGIVKLVEKLLTAAMQGDRP